MTENIEQKIMEYLVFYDLSDDYKRFIADNARIRYFTAGETIFGRGERAGHFYLLTNGDIELLETEYVTSASLPVHCVHEGELLGWSWLVPPYRWSYHCNAITDVELVEVDASAIKRKMDEDHEFGYQMQKRLMYTVVDRLKNTRLSLLGQEAKRVKPAFQES